MIDKTKLMKNAWKIAENGFYNECIRSLKGKFSIKSLKKHISDSLNGKRSWLNCDHVKRVLKINFTIKDFFAESLKISWAEAKKQEQRDFEKNLEIIETEHVVSNMAKINVNAPHRTLVAADKYDVGDMIHKNIITGLGRIFKPNSDMFSLGISPDTEYVQYAYFNLKK
jgi:hypothetical protein